MRSIWFFILSIILAGCLPENKKSTSYQLQVIRHRLLDSISSGSGLLLHHNVAFIISDNMNGFIEMDTANFSYCFYPFTAGDKKIIQSRDQKEDFENATIIHLEGQPHLLAIGSGSVSITREKILLFPPANPANHRILNSSPLYELIRKKLNIGTEQLNLEACFSSADSIYLLNRGTNQSIAIAIAAFEEMLSSGFKKMPLLTIKQYQLPEQEGFTASFSGGCYFNEEHFLFCATVEKVKNWVDDGEVAGSYIGVADFHGNVVHIAPLKDKGVMIKQKIESIDIKEKNKDGSLDIYAISDNDDGRSTWFLIHVLPG